MSIHPTLLAWAVSAALASIPVATFAQPDPATIASLVEEAISVVQSLNTDQDPEKAWRDQMSAQLAVIIGKLDAIQQQISDLENKIVQDFADEDVAQFRALIKRAQEDIPDQLHLLHYGTTQEKIQAKATLKTLATNLHDAIGNFRNLSYTQAAGGQHYMNYAAYQWLGTGLALYAVSAKASATDRLIIYSTLSHALQPDDLLNQELSPIAYRSLAWVRAAYVQSQQGAIANASSFPQACFAGSIEHSQMVRGPDPSINIWHVDWAVHYSGSLTAGYACSLVQDDNGGGTTCRGQLPATNAAALTQNRDVVCSYLNSQSASYIDATSNIATLDNQLAVVNSLIASLNKLAETVKPPGVLKAYPQVSRNKPGAVPGNRK